MEAWHGVGCDVPWTSSTAAEWFCVDGQGVDTSANEEVGASLGGVLRTYLTAETSSSKGEAPEDFK